MVVTNNKMESIENLIPQIIQWSKDRNINDPEKQLEKVIEELGERSKHIILKNASDEKLEKEGFTRESLDAHIKDDFGDIAVTVIIYAHLRKVQILVDEPLTYKCVITDLVKSLAKELDMILYDLHGLANKDGYDLTECLNLAWNEIKNRKGQTVNGTFIK